MNSVHFRKLLSEYRTQIMGFAILWIILHHIGFFSMYAFNPIVNFFIKLGSCGVDIFLVLSSFGLYMSYSNNSDIKRFYKRRLIRILPAFLIIVLFFHIKHLGESLSIGFWISEFLANWYISFILLAYLFYPLIYYIQKKKCFLPILVACILSLMGTIWLINIHEDSIHDVPMLMVQRIPVFCLGSLLADRRLTFYIKYVYIVNAVLLGCLLVAFATGREYLVYPLYFIWVLPLLMTLLLILNRMQNNKVTIMGQFLYFLGTISLELYLTHMKVIPVLLRHGFNGILGILLTVIGAIFVSVIVHETLKIIISLYEIRNNRCN